MHDDVIKWKHFPRYWPFVRGIHRSPVNSPHKGQWRGALMFTLICVWINGCVNTRKAGDLRRYCAHYGVTVMWKFNLTKDRRAMGCILCDFGQNWPRYYNVNAMMTSSNGNIFRVTCPLCGEFTGPGEFPAQRPVTRSFDVYFDLRLNKRLCKHS